MSVTNLAAGQNINLMGVLNTKLEKPILQSEMGIDVLATATGHAVRWNEFSVKHNNDGTFKTGIIATADIAAKAITAALIGDAAINQTKIKTRAAVALADAAATLTAAQMIDSGIFTITPTVARILTTDTAANIVVGLPGYQVGTWFEFTIVNNAAFDVTLAAGTGVTIVGKAIANNVSGTFLARVDSATAVSIYRK